jgi:hypothetical protein
MLLGNSCDFLEQACYHAQPIMARGLEIFC